MKDEVANTTVKNTSQDDFKEEEKDIANEPIEIEAQTEAKIEPKTEIKTKSKPEPKTKTSTAKKQSQSKKTMVVEDCDEQPVVASKTKKSTSKTDS